MLTEKSFRRLPLRDLLTDSEKRARDLAEHMNTTWIVRITDLRELSRPLRKRSHFPTLLALLNAYQKANETHQETEKLLDYLTQELEEIRNHAVREKANRL
jgi:uncharacterized protein YydD (DUF2326 family)